MSGEETLEAWVQRSLPCEGDPELFFSNREEDVRQAKLHCNTCPVKQQCLELALACETTTPGTRFGIYGATTPDERSSLIRRSYRQRKKEQGA